MFRPHPKSVTVKIPGKKAKRIKEESVPGLVKKLDAVFSLYVRLLNADKNGECKCCTCGTPHHYTKIQCGHFYSRKYYCIRWDERNTAPQDAKCNIFNQGEQFKFGEYLKKKYGEQVIDYLNTKKSNQFKLEKFNLRSLIAEYTLKVSELKSKLEL